MRWDLQAILAVGAIFMATCAAQADSPHHDWSTSLSTDGRSVFAGNVNSDGSVLMETCSATTKVCTWLMGGDTACEQGKSSPALINTEKYAGHIDLVCNGKLESGPYSYSFSDWKTLESLIKDSKFVGIAVAIGDTKFKVYRFSLFGMTEAQAEAESAWKTLLKRDQTSPLNNQNTSNSVY